MLPFMMLSGMEGLGSTMRPLEPTDEDRRRRKRANRTTEESKESFTHELALHNQEKVIEFPKWNIFVIDGFPVVASNPKTARKTLTFLLKTNGVTTNEGMENSIKSEML